MGAVTLPATASIKQTTGAGLFSGSPFLACVSTSVSEEKKKKKKLVHHNWTPGDFFSCDPKAFRVRIATVKFRSPTAMGLSSLPTPSDSVLTLVLVNTALTISILKQLLRSLTELLRLRAPPPLPSDHAAGDQAQEPHSLTERFRTWCQPVRFGSTLGWRRERTADCRVCLARFEPDSVVNRLLCGHFFHKTCLEKWLDYQHATCPLCRTPVLPGEEPGVACFISTSSWPWF